MQPQEKAKVTQTSDPNFEIFFHVRMRKMLEFKLEIIRHAVSRSTLPVTSYDIIRVAKVLVMNYLSSTTTNRTHRLYI